MKEKIESQSKEIEEKDGMIQKLQQEKEALLQIVEKKTQMDKMKQQGIDKAPPLKLNKTEEQILDVDRPPLRVRSGSVTMRDDLPPRIINKDDTWKEWVIDPYIYENWTFFQNQEDVRETNPLILPIKGHQWE